MNKHSDLTSRMASKRQAESDLESLMQDNSSVTVKLGSERHKQIELRQQMNSYRASVERDREKGKVSPYEERLRATEEEYQRCSETITKLEKRQLGIAEDKQSLEQLIAEADAGADVDEVIAHQNALAAARDEVERLQALISEQEESLDSLTLDADERLDALQERREEVLADIALGEDNQDELKSLDKEIESIIGDTDGSQREALEKYRHASQTVSGLKVRLQRQEEKLAELEAMSEGVIEQFLLDQGNKLASGFAKHAKQLIESFVRLKAIDELLMEKGGRNAMTYVPGDWYRTFIPAIGSAGADAPFIAESANYAEQVHREIERFRNMGLSGLF